MEGAAAGDDKDMGDKGAARWSTLAWASSARIGVAHKARRRGAKARWLGTSKARAARTLCPVSRPITTWGKGGLRRPARAIHQVRAEAELLCPFSCFLKRCR